MNGVMMMCGHSANGATSSGAPVCVICLGILKGAETPMPPEQVAALTQGRTMRCDECGRTAPSNPAAPFFASRPEEAMDEYYSGCMGWD